MHLWLIPATQSPSAQCPLGSRGTVCVGARCGTPGRFSEGRGRPAANGPQRRFDQPANPPIPGRASTSLPSSPDIALQRLCPRPHWPRFNQPATCNLNLLASRCCSHRRRAPPPRRRPTPAAPTLTSPRSPAKNKARGSRSPSSRVETNQAQPAASPGLVEKGAIAKSGM